MGEAKQWVIASGNAVRKVLPNFTSCVDGVKLALTQYWYNYYCMYVIALTSLCFLFIYCYFKCYVQKLCWLIVYNCHGYGLYTSRFLLKGIGGWLHSLCCIKYVKSSTILITCTVHNFKKELGDQIACKTFIPDCCV